MPVRVNNTRSLERGMVAAAVIAIGMILCKLVQLALCRDLEEGVLQGSPLRYVLDVLLLIGAAGILFFSCRMSRAVHSAGELSISPVAANGVGMLLAGLGFLVQGIIGLVDGVSSVGQARMIWGFTQVLDGQETINFLAIGMTLLSLLSAAILLIAGYRILFRRGLSPSMLFLLPTLWGVVLLLHLLTAFPYAVSMQTDGAKTLLAILSLAYTLDFAEQYSSEGAPDTMLRLLIRFVCPTLVFVGTLPYLLMSLFGIGDAVVSFPLFAVLGMSLYGVISVPQIALTARAKLAKRQRLAEYEQADGNIDTNNS